MYLSSRLSTNKNNPCHITSWRRKRLVVKRSSRGVNPKTDTHKQRSCKHYIFCGMPLDPGNSPSRRLLALPLTGMIQLLLG